MKKKYSLGIPPFIAILIGVMVLLPAHGEPIPPWVDPVTPPYTMYWVYDFNDGNIPPTITQSGGNWVHRLANPAFTFTGSGDAVSSTSGMLGIHNATQASVVDIRILVDNDYDAANTKYFWFAYDFMGIMPETTAGTDRTGHTVSGITYTGNTVGNHIEGYITIDPQPENEWMNLRLMANAGETTVIGNLHIGSTCIPEPASSSLIALGGLGSWFARQRRQRKFRKRKKGIQFEELNFALPFLTEELSTSTLGGHRERLAYRIK